ncbi:MAG: hypothetical protein PHQ04_03340 [Opitutaceae bacterium]|nr:hypothetical protein [Opitutaceae bacterium]
MLTSLKPPALIALALAWSVISLTAETPCVDSGLPTYKPEGHPVGTLTIARLASTETLVGAWVREFNRLHPEVRARQSENGTDLPAVCLQQLMRGDVGIAPFVRDIQPPEMAQAKAALAGEPLEIAIATGSRATRANGSAIAIYVNSANPLSRLTLAQLDAIFSETRRRGHPEAIDRWGQLGLTGEWANAPIHCYGMVVNRPAGATYAGVVYFLMHRLMLDGKFKSDVIQFPDTAAGRGNNRVFDNIVSALAADRLGIGYAGFFNQIPGVKTVALAESEGQPFYVGTADEVARRAYPLSRTMYAFVKRRPIDSLVREFMLYVLSRDGQQAVAEDPANFLPLPAAVAARERAKLD